MLFPDWRCKEEQGHFPKLNSMPLYAVFEKQLDAFKKHMLVVMIT